MIQEEEEEEENKPKKQKQKKINLLPFHFVLCHPLPLPALFLFYHNSLYDRLQQPRSILIKLINKINLPRLLLFFFCAQ